MRLKRYIEMRGADGGPWWRLCALPAFWVGLLYDGVALDAAWDVVKSWTAEERGKLRNDAPRLGLKAELRGRSLLEIGREVLAISADGLRRRRRLSDAGEAEDHYLDPLRAVIASGRTPAEDLLELYRSKWEGSVDRAYTDLAY